MLEPHCVPAQPTVSQTLYHTYPSSRSDGIIWQQNGPKRRQVDDWYPEDVAGESPRVVTFKDRTQSLGEPERWVSRAPFPDLEALNGGLKLPGAETEIRIKADLMPSCKISVLGLLPRTLHLGAGLSLWEHSS